MSGFEAIRIGTLGRVFEHIAHDTVRKKRGIQISVDFFAAKVAELVVEVAKVIRGCNIVATVTVCALELSKNEFTILGTAGTVAGVVTEDTLTMRIGIIIIISLVVTILCGTAVRASIVSFGGNIKGFGKRLNSLVCEEGIDVVFLAAPRMIRIGLTSLYSIEGIRCVGSEALSIAHVPIIFASIRAASVTSIVVVTVLIFVLTGAVVFRPSAK
jgi:hypothetical protein